MRIQYRPPLHITEGCGTLSRIYNVGEKDGSQNPIRFNRFLSRVHKTSNFGKYRSTVLKPNKMILARQFYHSRIWNRRGHVSSVLDRSANVSNAMDYQCRRLDTL